MVPTTTNQEVPPRPTAATVRSGSGAREPALRIAINLLTEDPSKPSGAHWCWTPVIPEIAKRLEPGEELHLMVSPTAKHHYQGYGPGVHYLMYPWSNEHRWLRTASEHLYSPVRLPLSRIDVLATLMAPILNPSWTLALHMKTMHAYTTPESLSLAVRAYRRFSYPRSTRLASAIIVNSESLRSEVLRYLDVDPAKIKVVYEAIDHDLFKPGDRAKATATVARHGLNKPFALFVSSLWPYKNCEGLLKAWAIGRERFGGRQLAIVGFVRSERYADELKELAARLGIAEDVVFVGGVSHEETALFYQAADLLVYPSFSETFGLPILEAMACECPVVTSNISSMPETAGGAAVLCDPHQPASIARAIEEALAAGRDGLRDRGKQRASTFTWATAGAQTLDVYREVGEMRKAGRSTK